MLAAMSSRAVKIDCAAMPRTRRRAGWASASQSGSGVAVEAFDGVAQGGVGLVPGWAGVGQVLAVAGADVRGDGDRCLAADPGWFGWWLEYLGASVAGCQRGLAQRADQPGAGAGGGAGQALVAVGVGSVFVLELVGAAGGDLLVVGLAGDGVAAQAGGGGDQRLGQGGAVPGAPGE